MSEWIAVDIIAAEAGVTPDTVVRWAREDGLATYYDPSGPGLYLSQSALLWKLLSYRRGHLSLDQLAAEAGVGRATVWRWIEQDNLTTYKLPRDRRTYVERSDVLRALAARRRGTHRPKTVEESRRGARVRHVYETLD